MEVIETSPNTKVESQNSEQTASNISKKEPQKIYNEFILEENQEESPKKDEIEHQLPKNETENKEDSTNQIDYMQQSMGEDTQYFENPELYDPALFYGYFPEMQDPSYFLYSRGRPFRGRGQSRGSSWKKSPNSTKKKRSDQHEEKALTEPITDLSSWPTLDSAVKNLPSTHEKKEKENTEKKVEEGNESIHKEELPIDITKKKVTNWIPFKDIGSPPRQFSSSKGRGSKRRNEGSKSYKGESRRGEFRRGRGRNYRGSFPNTTTYQSNYMPVMVLEGEILTEVIQKQIEYYFSVENLCKDLYLRGHMDPEGWVPTSLLAGFNRVKALINDPEEIIESLTYSEILECKDGKLRRKDDWKVWLLPLTEKKPDEDKKDEKKGRSN